MTSRAKSKYKPLTAHLRAQHGKSVRMSFAEIERVIGAKLPCSAAVHRAFWSNNPSNNVMTRAWLEAGFESEQVDLGGRKLVFRRMSSPAGSLKAPAASPSRGTSPGRAALFGWLQGTVASTGDLTEPADPDWAERVDDEYPPAA
jgi:hypothetical protein